MTGCTSFAMITAGTLFASLVRYFQPAVGSISKLHMKCRNSIYPCSSIQRFAVPDDRVSWDVPFQEYAPVRYTAAEVTRRPEWADPDFEAELPKDDIWNKFDSVNQIDRRSRTGIYSVVNGLPRNPIGRTGICGRGLLGRWGPNQGGDPVVTRWKRDEVGQRVVHQASDKPILQFVCIKRKDSGEWSLPGGMVDPGEAVTTTVKREFIEEAMDSLALSEDDQKRLVQQISDFFKKYSEVYSGYVDDARNTDNAWMEAVIYNFHDETGEYVGQLQLHAGNEVLGVKWTDMDHSLQVNAGHVDFIRTVARSHDAHW